MSGDSYQLGIDLGTTFTAAAVIRGGQVKVVGLGNRAPVIPSVVYVAADETTLAGEAAARRAVIDPDRAAREFKRRMGDTTPVLLGGAPYPPEALTAELLYSVIAKVVELEGGPPTDIAVTYPANWGPYKQGLLEEAIRSAGVTATTLTEPEAAAIAYASNERVEPGATVAVYDLGGGTFDAAILSKTEDGLTIVGKPEGIDRMGGIDFDEAVVAHVRGALGDALDRLDFDDPATIQALVGLRQQCVEAKEALSADTEAVIPVSLPGVQANVRLTRSEFEQMVEPTVAATIDCMRRTLASAQAEPSDITAVLLVGGSSRIPLVAQLVSEAFARPVAVDAHPKYAVAIGAVHCAAMEAQSRLASASPAPPHRESARREPADPEQEPDTGASYGMPAITEVVSTQSVPALNGATQQPDHETIELPPWVRDDDSRATRISRVQWVAIAVLVLGGVFVIPGALALNNMPESEAVTTDRDAGSEPAGTTGGNTESEPAGRERDAGAPGAGEGSDVGEDGTSDGQPAGDGTADTGDAADEAGTRADSSQTDDGQSSKKPPEAEPEPEPGREPKPEPEPEPGPEPEPKPEPEPEPEPSTEPPAGDDAGGEVVPANTTS